jgi:hypothetical protein
MLAALRLIKRSLTLLAAFCVVLTPHRSSARAQVGETEQEAQKLSSALANLKLRPSDPNTQQLYIEAFPHTYKQFLGLFDYKQPLSDGYEYVDALESVAANHEREVGSLLVQLAKDAHYEPDAPSYLQQATASYGSQHPVQFASLLKQLSVKDRGNLIAFLADVENHSSYPQYEGIIRGLKAQNEIALAQQFEDARTKRKVRHHH